MSDFIEAHFHGLSSQQAYYAATDGPWANSQNSGPSRVLSYIGPVMRLRASTVRWVSPAAGWTHVAADPTGERGNRYSSEANAP